MIASLSSVMTQHTPAHHSRRPQRTASQRMRAVVATIGILLMVFAGIGVAVSTLLAHH